ncbi:uncharacterized protein SCHCODRAFT_02696751 [Schizophyllum commune H4-8]|nr:uncharacterized protein SCHCODRAFT_02696751 [Schizophyllum commune H4-8]KAI5898159.1 hypothetical protein SCHCODRAFT_02696751 [Schizophyllum commune H4-8]
MPPAPSLGGRNRAPVAAAAGGAKSPAAQRARATAGKPKPSKAKEGHTAIVNATDDTSSAASKHGKTAAGSRGRVFTEGGGVAASDKTSSLDAGEVEELVRRLAAAGLNVTVQPLDAVQEVSANANSGIKTNASRVNAPGANDGPIEDDVEMGAPDQPGASRIHHSMTAESSDDESDEEMTLLRPGTNVSSMLNANEDKAGEGEDVEMGGDVQLVARPDGTAGNDYSIQEEMGLAGVKGSKKHQTYLSIVRRIRDYVIAAQLNVEKEWRQIAPEDKGKLYRVARTDIPFLQRFVNDWATEEIAKRYLKNKRQHLYRTGELARPTKYAHLKANAAKRDRDGSRRKKALVNAEAAKRAKTKKAATAAKKARKVSKSRAPPESAMDVEEEA